MAARRIITLLLLMIVGWYSPMMAESTRSLIDEGNKSYDKEDYVGAEVEYRKALEQENDLVEGKFNLGGALYKQGKFDGSTQSLDETLDTVADDEMAARTWFNRGNALFKQQMYPESIDSYIQSLKLDPEDIDAKHNLLYARKMLQEQQQQQSQQQPSDGEQDENREDQEKKEERSEDQDQEKSESDDPSDTAQEREEQRDEMTDESKSEMEERQISKSEAERILQALEENEKEVQKKLRAKPAGRARVEKDW